MEDRICTNINALPYDCWIRLSDIVGNKQKKGFYPISASTFWRLVEKGLMPPPVKFGTNSAWMAGEVRDAMEKFMQVKTFERRICGFITIPPMPNQGLMHKSLKRHDGDPGMLFIA